MFIKNQLKKFQLKIFMYQTRYLGYPISSVLQATMIVTVSKSFQDKQHKHHKLKVKTTVKKLHFEYLYINKSCSLKLHNNVIGEYFSLVHSVCIKM